MYEVVHDVASREGDYPALSFYGRDICYNDLSENIELTARAFRHIGVRKAERVMVCLPNIPQAIYCIYGLNRIGATSVMAHPLSAVGELITFLEETRCDKIVILDQFYDKIKSISQKKKIDKIIVASISDELGPIRSICYKFFKERTYPGIEKKDSVIRWSKFIAGAYKEREDLRVRKDPHSEAIVLFSGGTTGIAKGIRLSDYNFNALALQTATVSGTDVRHKKMLAAMPIFHGFGLGVCIHTMLYAGGTSLLVPRFTPQSYALLIKKQHPNFIAGVPSLFEAIRRGPFLKGVDLSCLVGVFCGGDTLSVNLKKKLDKALTNHKATIRGREGYGATECLAVCCLTPSDKEKEGSIGIANPDTVIRICKPGTEEELPYGQDGEICICGPTVMIGYLNHRKENTETLHKDTEGRIWLHTGDLGAIDEEGYVYFKQRIKRMIITNGYNVYPSQLESILNSHPAVKESCVIGVPDPQKMQKVKAFVVLEEGYKDNPDTRKRMMDHCKANIAKYALPYTIEVIKELPTTSVGKISYTKLS